MYLVRMPLNSRLWQRLKNRTRDLWYGLEIGERRKVEELSARRRELHFIKRKHPQNNCNIVVDARGGFLFGCELLPLSLWRSALIPSRFLL